MSEELLLSPAGQFLFMVVWTSMAALFAWIGLSMIVPGYRDRQFRYLFMMTIRESERPLIFKLFLYGATVPTGLACLFVPIGLAFVAISFAKMV